MIQKNDIISGEITGLAFGGQGILRHEGCVVFVPYTAFGDMITCKITRTKKNFAEAQLVEVLSPSKQRIQPLCRYYGICGGCQLQHLNYQAQLDYKHTSVKDALKRIGKMDVDVSPVVPAIAQWAYRRHITLSMNPNGNVFSGGYISADNTSLIEVEGCPIFVEDNDPIIQNVQAIIGKFKSTPSNKGRVSILKHTDNQYILHFSFLEFPDNYKKVCEGTLSQFRNIVGIVMTSNNVVNFGTTFTSCEIDGIAFAFSPLVFIQNHPEQSANIYRHVCGIAKKSNAKCILDLYCGIGITSILLAKQGAKVVGVEFNRESIRLAKENAAHNKTSNAHFIQSDVQVVLKDMLRKHQPDLVLINPPRTGMDKSVSAMLTDYFPKDIIYISCMPATLSRDLQQLCEKKYRVLSCQPFDMFPQTAHVETVVHLQRD